MTWTGAANDGQWQTAGNWSPSNVPTAADYACIPAAAGPVAISGSAGAGGVDAEGPGLTIQGTLNLTGTTQPSIINAVTLSGSLGTAAPLTLNGQATWYTGSLFGAGTFLNTGTLSLLTNGTLNLYSLLVNQGTVRAGPGNAPSLCIFDGNTLENSATLAIAGIATLATGTNNCGAGNGSGRVLNDASGTITGNGTISSLLDNNGVVSLGGGTLEIHNGNSTGQSDSGTYTTVAGQGSINLRGGARTFAPGAAIAGGDATGTGVYLLGGVLSGTLNLTGDMYWGTTFESGGSFANAILTGPGRLHLSTNQTLTLGGNLTNRATIQGSYDGFSDSLCLGPGAILENAGSMSIPPGGVSACNGAVSTRLQNDAGGILTASFGANSAAISTAFSNAGSLQVYTGSLGITGAFSNYDSTTRTLAGGNYQVLQLPNFSAELRFANADVANLAATVIVDGNGAQISDLSHLNAFRHLSTITSAGALTLADGSVVADANALDNEGTLTLGLAAVLNVGASFTVGHTATVGTIVGGTSASARYGKVTAVGAATLDGTLMISVAPGFTPALGDSYSVLAYGSLTGTFAQVNGTSINSNESFRLDYQAAGLVLTVQPVTAGIADLATTSVSGPSSGVVNRPVTVTWTVTNLGGLTASSSWVDSVYVTAGSVYDTTAVLVGRATHTGSLATGVSYTGTLTAELPGLLPGTYHLLVVADSGASQADANRANNVSASGPIAIDVQPLTVGTPLTASLGAGQYLYYRVRAPQPGNNLVIAGAFSAPPQASVFDRFAAIPSPFVYDQRSGVSVGQSLQVGIANSQAGDYFILVRSTASQAQTVTLSATVVSLAITSVSPASGSNQGRTTSTVRGTGFSVATRAFLVGSDGITHSATQLTFVDGTTLFAGFDLTGFTARAYDVRLTDGSQVANAAGAFNVTGGPAGLLQITSAAPSSVRYGWPSTVTVTLQNMGATDVYVPIVRLRATGNDAVAAPGSSTYMSSVDLVNPDFSSPLVGALPRSVLPPGTFATFAFGFKSTTTTPHVPLTTEAQVVASSQTAPIDWSALLSASRPPGISPATWATITSNIAGQMGATEGSYALGLLGLIAEASRFGVTLSSEQGAMRYLVQRTVATTPGAPVTGTLFRQDAAHPLGNTSLFLDDSNGAAAYGTTSWYDGRFSVWDVAPASYAIVVAGYLPRPVQQVNVAPLAMGLSVVVLPGATIVGTVTRADTHAPVTGAIVTAADAEGSLRSDPTGADGTYRIAGLDAGSVLLMAFAPGLKPLAPQTVSTAAGAVAQNDLVLAPGASVTGKVVSPAGSPPPAGTVVVAAPFGQSGLASGTVSTDGTFEVDGLVPGEYTVVASAQGFGDGVKVVTISGTTPVTGQIISLALAGTVIGAVTDSDTGQPLAGVAVVSSGLGAGPSIMTDAAGHYSISGLTPGFQRLQVVPSDGAHLPQTVPITVAAGSTQTVNVLLPPPGTLTAIVRDTNGRLLPEVRLTLVGPGPQDDPGATTSETLQTDANAAITENGLIPGSYDLQVLGSSVHQAFSISNTNRNPAYTIVVPVAKLHGRILDASGQEAPGILVSVAEARRPLITVQTASDGSYAFSLTRSETVDLVAAGTAVGVLVAPGVTATVGADTAVGDLRAGSAVLSVSADDGSIPIAGAEVTLSLPSSGPGFGALGSSTDSQGRTAVPNLRPGTYQVSVGDGIHAPLTQTISIGTGASAFAAHLGIGGSVAGRVTDSIANPIAGATVVGVSSSGAISTSTTASDGTYTLHGLPGGSSDISISRIGYASLALSGVLISAGGPPANANATLSSTGATLSINMVAANPGDPLPAVLATLRDSTGTAVAAQPLGPAVTPANRSATTAFAPLTPGTYTLILSRPGIARSAQTLTIGSGGASLSVTPPTGSGLPPTITGPLGTPPTEPTGTWRELLQSWLDFFGLGGDRSYPQRGRYDTRTFNQRVLLDAYSFLGDCASPDLLKLQQRMLALYNAKEKFLDEWFELYKARVKDAGAELGLDAIQIIQLVRSLVNAIGGFTDLANAIIAESAEGFQLLPYVKDFLNAVADLERAIIDYAAKPDPEHEKAVETFADILGTIFDTLRSIATPLLQKTGQVASNLAGSLFALYGLYKEIRATYDTFKESMQSVKALADSMRGAQANYEQYVLMLGQALQDFEGALKDTGCHPPTPPGQTTTSDNRNTGDPNAINGPAGIGLPRWVAGGSSLGYQVEFQNVPTSNAAVVQVVVTEPVPSSVDPGSVQLLGFGFGNTTMQLAAGGQSFQQRLDKRSTIGDYVDVSGSFDTGASAITWIFSAIDPTTGTLDTRPGAGFLPPDSAAGDGEGFVSYGFQLNAGLTTGTDVTAQASIVFDRNAAIATQVWSNRVDSTSPQSQVGSLPTLETSPTFPVTWSGNDVGSGVGSFTISVSDNGGPSTPWLLATTATSGSYAGQRGHTYAFASQATDAVGNIEARHSSADTSTTVAGGTTTTRASSSVNPSLVGQAVTLTATLSPATPGAGSPTGSVQFALNGANLGPPVVVVGGVAQITTGSLPIGHDVITATYSGDAYFTGSTTPPLIQLVRNNVIGFSSTRDGNLELYIMKPDGTVQTRLTFNPAQDSEPVLSPDGTRVAFTSTRSRSLDIWVMNTVPESSTNVATDLTKNSAINLDPTWSPDGSRLAFASNRSGRFQIWMMNRDGTGLVRLTNDAANDLNPAWSPDGTRLAFASDASGRFQIYVGSLSLSPSPSLGSITRLTSDSATDLTPAWSPDGSLIAYTGTASVNPEIWVISSKPGSVGVRETSNRGAFDMTPTWSPDGTRIAFTSIKVWSVQIDEITYNSNGLGTGLIQVTSGATNEFPNWCCLAAP